MIDIFQYTEFLVPLIAINSIVISFLIFFTIFWIFFYIKKKKKFFTIKKLSLMALFFSIFIVQAFIGVNTSFVWISFDIATIMVVGFLFGPLEGLIYAIAADWTRVLIQGYQPQLYYAIQYPLTGMISGTFGYFFSKNKEKNNIMFSSIFVQMSIILITSTGFSMVIYDFQSGAWRNAPEIWQVAITSAILFSALEILFWFMFYKHKNDQLFLITILLLIVILSRTVNGIIIKPIGDTYWYSSSFQAYINLITVQVFKSSYLIPGLFLIVYILITGSMFAADQVGDKKNFGFQV